MHLFIQRIFSNKVSCLLSVFNSIVCIIISITHYTVKISSLNSSNKCVKLLTYRSNSVFHLNTSYLQICSYLSLDVDIFITFNIFISQTVGQSLCIYCLFVQISMTIIYTCSYVCACKLHLFLCFFL